MRAIFGVVSLLIVLAVVGIAAKKQLQAVNNVGATSPAPQTTPDTTTVAPAASTARAKSQQLQQRMEETRASIEARLGRLEKAGARPSRPATGGERR